MSVAALLEELRDHGIAVWTDGPWLEWSGPPGAMTADLECRLAEQKPAVDSHFLAWPEDHSSAADLSGGQ